jgi:carbamoyltransferase
MKILGISAFYHNSAAALIIDGLVVAAAEEERFTRIKNDSSFPAQSILYCLESTMVSIDDLDAIVFYEKPFLKFERIIETTIKDVPRGYRMFVQSIPIWIKHKLLIKNEIRNGLKTIFANSNEAINNVNILFSEHHLSHAASSFFASNFSSAAILTIDGVGEWATASISYGKGNSIQTLSEMKFPHSVGLLYSAFTAFLGFEVNNGEYKVMGLAPYVDEKNTEVARIRNLITSKMLTLHQDGSISLNKVYFNFSSLTKMLSHSKTQQLLKIKSRKPNEPIEQEHIYLAQAIQSITSEVMIKMAKYARLITGSHQLCISGGVALNCVANGKLLEEGIFDDIYIQPASGDSGGALGAAWAAYYLHFKKDRVFSSAYDQMYGAKLGPEYHQERILDALKTYSVNYVKLNYHEFIDNVAMHLVNGKVVGWFNGKMEFGPRALGSRSILASPLLDSMQSVLNQKVKKREGFRPFAPIMLRSEFEKLFGLKHESPYMLFVHKILDAYRTPNEIVLNDLVYTINQKRSILPAITHIDYSSRIQTINDGDDNILNRLLLKYKEQTGYGVLINTSFNIKDEPIVCTPEDAINCFLQTDIDILAFENIIVTK